MATQSFLSEINARHPNFVLKLRLVGVEGDPQIRRVRLHRIEADGKVSHPALVEIAIQCTFPDDAGLAPEDCEVSLTYYDVDNDCITIGCTEELVDAIEQFARVDSPVLKITTHVKRREGRAPRAGERQAAASDEDHPSVPPAQGDRPAQLPKLLESFVAALSKALESLQQQINEVNQSGKPSSTSSASHDAKHKSKATDEEEEDDAVKEVVRNIGATEETKEARPFIHGRHTCNGCLCTPIIGTRHHATNMNDYDLCTKCRDQYKGSEIQFEEVELDRDRPFQERWHRKRARFAGHAACRHQGRGQRCGPAGQRPFRGGRRGGPAFRWQEGTDDALNEAIRRSLQDAKSEPKPPATSEADANTALKPLPLSGEEVKTVPAMEVHSTSIAAAEPSADASVPVEELKPSVVEPPPLEESKPSAATDEIQETVFAITAEETSDASFSSEAAGYGDAAENLGKTLDECANAINAMVTELDRAYTGPGHTDDDASDEGQDLVAESVADKSMAGSIGSNEKVEGVDGQTIVDGDQDIQDDEDDKKSNSSEDEWHVVGEDDQVANDEMIARAAQLIGSALFQTDLRNSETGTQTFSTLSNSGNYVGDESMLSLPSSVPSVTSGISPSVLDRFAPQLWQLHELGFCDDARNVDVLEHLNAARIGVDDDDEISVTHVVNALLKAQENVFEG